MHRRCGCGLLSWLLASLVGCTSPATSADPVDDQPSSAVPAGPVTNETDAGPISIRFVNDPPGLVVSCEDCPGLPPGNRKADEFPTITAPMGTTIDIKLTAPGFVSRSLTITLSSAHVDVPVELAPLDANELAAG